MTQILGGVISLFGGCDSPLCPAIHTLDSPTNSLPGSPAHPDTATHECAWCFDQTRIAVGKRPRLIMEDLPRTTDSRVPTHPEYKRDHPTHHDTAAHECAWCFDQTRDAVGKRPRVVMECLPLNHRPSFERNMPLTAGSPWAYHGTAHQTHQTHHREPR